MKIALILHNLWKWSLEPAKLPAEDFKNSCLSISCHFQFKIKALKTECVTAQNISTPTPPMPFVWCCCHLKIISGNKDSLLRKGIGYSWSIIFIHPFHTATCEVQQGASPAQDCTAQNPLQVSGGHVTKIWPNEIWTNALTLALHYTFRRTGGGGGLSPALFSLFPLVERWQ